MKVIIVEDERPARERLESILTELVPELQVLGRFDTVKKTAAWLLEHIANPPDLLFLDIHLADDLSFKIFEQIKKEYLSKVWFNSDFQTQIKEIAHNIRNTRSNQSIKQTRIYNPEQFNILSIF